MIDAIQTLRPGDSEATDDEDRKILFNSRELSPLSEKALDALEPPRCLPARLSENRRRHVDRFGAGATTAQAQSPINPSGIVDATQVDSWVAIGADESITVLSGKCEFGTGIRTLQLQLAAEELSVPMDRITLVLCRTGVTPNQGYTAGSFSTWTQFGSRRSSHCPRYRARRVVSVGVPIPRCGRQPAHRHRMACSRSRGDPTYTVSYGQLVQGQRFNLAVNAKAVPNDPSTWKVLGKSVPRVDFPAKVKGTFQYVQKVRVPGMLHGKVVRPPALGAHLQNIDKTDALNGMPGNPQIVMVNDFAGVVADTEWHAQKAASALAGGDHLVGRRYFSRSGRPLYVHGASSPRRDAFAVNTGDVDKVMATAAKTLTCAVPLPLPDARLARQLLRGCGRPRRHRQDGYR